jgi:hypothetical protein
VVEAATGKMVKLPWEIGLRTLKFGFALPPHNSEEQASVITTDASPKRNKRRWDIILLRRREKLFGREAISSLREERWLGNGLHENLLPSGSAASLVT